MHPLCALGGSDQIQDADVLAAFFLQHRDTRSSAAAGGVHRLQHQDIRIRCFCGELASVANKIDATRKPLESLAVFTFSRVILSFDFHRCHIDTRWIRTTEAVIRGLVSLIFRRSQPSFFVFGENSQEIYCTNIKNLCCVVWQHIYRR